MKENNITQNTRQRIKICTLFLSAAVFAVMYYIHLNIDNLPWDGYVFRWLTHEYRSYNRIILYEVFALTFALIGWWRVSNMLTFGSWLLIIAGDIFGSIPGDYSNPDNYIPDRDYGVPIYIIGMLFILITGCLIEFLVQKKAKKY